MEVEKWVNTALQSDRGIGRGLVLPLLPGMKMDS
jgi:hypothetical protein